MDFATILEKIIAKEDIRRDEARWLMGRMFAGKVHDAQIGAFLVALRIKGCVPEELVGFAEAMRETAKTLKHHHAGLVDTCGTGGGRASFNISSGAAIVAAAAGAKVAKHGNRAVTSKCGSADVLEKLGVKLIDSVDGLEKVLNEVGLVFMFAPHHHPAMAHVGPSRKVLRFRTVFNQLGPLANPAEADRQLLGVYDFDMLSPMAEAMRMLGAERAFVVHSSDNMDEISPCDATRYATIREGKAHEAEWTPQDFGQEPLPVSATAPGASIAESAEILIEAISKVDSPRAKAIIPSSAAALVLADLARTTLEGAEMAREAISSGKATEKLAQLVEATNRA